jgi:hypothetical protein
VATPTKLFSPITTSSSLAHALRTVYLLKAKWMPSNNWVNTETNEKSVRQMKRYANDVSYLLRLQSEENIECAARILNKFLDSNMQVKESVNQQEDVSVAVLIVRNIRLYMQNKLDKKLCKQEKEALNVLLTACTGDGESSNEKIRLAIGSTKKTFYNKKNTCEKYHHIERKKIVIEKSKLQKQCIREFCHSDEATRIDSHTKRIVEVPSLEEDNIFGDGTIIEKHPGRVWEVSTVDEQYKMFCESRTLDAYTHAYGNHFHVPSRSFFYENRCPCVKPAKIQSCVDIIVSGMSHYMCALNKFINQNKELKRTLTYCSCSQHLLPINQQWQRLLGGRVDELVEAVCCPKEAHPKLVCGVGSSAYTPSFIKWECAFGTCINCGIETKMRFSECNILKNCDSEVNVMEWVLAPRQGVDKKGRQNTQLELGMRKQKVSEVVSKFKHQLVQTIKHMCEHKWKSHCLKLDMTMSNPLTSRVFCTDFGATLDLSAIEKDNSSVNSHAVVCIFFVLYEWREVKINMSDNKIDKMM